ncbi:hypothetical protein HmCms191_04611 [Escherichia coli]|nr:hypothetical protein [Escherichia coli]GCT43830.1 hypothetical protein HmCms191_04611 [Escherichia coli]
MESNIKGLVAAGHEMASELKAECGAVDMRSVAKLISDLATQLEVQLARANALAEDQQKAIESIKQADSAVKLAHEKFSVLAAENAGLKTAHPQPFGPEMMKALDAYEKHQDEVPEVGMLDAFFILRDSIRVKTPATDAFLAEVRAQGVEMMREHPSIKLCSLTHICDELAAQLRKGVQS